MDALKEFIIPIEGLSDGVHQFDFQLDKVFFEQFENSPIQEGKFDLKLYFDKRPDMLVLTFDFKGSFETDCDRCLEVIDLPVSDSQQIMVKYDNNPREDAEIVYISRDTQMLNVAKYVYESIGLAIPISKTCDDTDDSYCNENMLDYLDGADETAEKKDNPIWDALKDLKKDN